MNPIVRFQGGVRRAAFEKSHAALWAAGGDFDSRRKSKAIKFSCHFANPDALFFELF